MSEKKPRFRFSSKIVVASVSAVLFYTIFIFFLELLNVKYGTNIQIPSELTAAWYAFWTVELVCLASIRKTKIKNKYEYDDPDRKLGSLEYLNKLKEVPTGTQVVTPSVSQVPAEVEVFTGNQPTVTMQDQQEISTASVSDVPSTGDTSTSLSSNFTPMTEYYNPKIVASTNEELDNSLPRIDDVQGYNNAFPNDKYITGG